jgi:hypothetical protein
MHIPKLKKTHVRKKNYGVSDPAARRRPDLAGCFDTLGDRAK